MSTDVEVQRFEHGKRALAKMRELIQTEFGPLLRTITRNPKLEVVPDAQLSATDGQKVYLLVPWELGETLEHDRSLCGQRGEYLAMLCPACQVLDVVRGDAFHESAHITEKTFMELSPWKRWDMIADIFSDVLATMTTQEVSALRNKVIGAKQTLAAFAQCDPWFQMTWNCVEDTYVNRRLFAARPGTIEPLKAGDYRALLAGFKRMDGGEADWSKADPSKQAIMAAYIIGHELESDEMRANFPDVAPIFDDVEIRDLMLNGIPEDCTIQERVEAGFKLLALLRKHEHCPRPSYSIMPPPPPPPPSEPKEQPNDTSSEGQDSDQSSEQGSDPSPQDENEADAEDDPQADEAEGESEGPGTEEDDGEAAPGEPESDEEGSESEGEGESTPDEQAGNEAGEGDDETDEGDEGEAQANDSGEGDDEADDKSDDGDDQDEGEGDDQASGASGGDEDDDEAEVNEAGQSAAQDEGPTDAEIEQAIKDFLDEMMHLMGHGDKQVNDEHVEDMERVIEQDAFDEPSETLWGVKVIDYGEAFGGYETNLGIIQVPETVIAKPKNHLRVVFAENRKIGIQHDLKRGPRLDGRHLHRIAAEDYRIFAKRNIPKQRDWFVVVGLDISSSNNSNGALQPMKEAAVAIGQMLQAIGVKFVMEAHTCASRIVDGAYKSYLVHCPIKDEHQVWDREAIRKISGILGKGGNMDGHSMERYRKLMDASRATDKLIMYFTDGEMHGSGEERDVLEHNIKLCRQRQYNLLGIGYKTDSPKQYGLDTIVYKNGQDVAAIVAGLDRYLSR